MMRAVIDANGGTMNGDTVAVMKELAALQRDFEKGEAEKQFTRDFVRLKQALARNPVKALCEVKGNDGIVRYRFADLDEVDGKLAPIALDHGFTYSFGEAESAAGRITKVCRVQHIGGHSVSNSFTVSIGSGPPKCSASQVDGAAHTYAKRGALCDAFGIIADKDTDGAPPAGDDARFGGRPVTQSQADELRDFCEQSKSDRAKFLVHAGVGEAGRFEDIPAARFEDLQELLIRKIKKLEASQ